MASEKVPACAHISCAAAQARHAGAVPLIVVKMFANVCSIKNKKEREGEKRGGDGHSGSRRERERVRERKRHNGSVCRGAGAGADPSEISLWLAKKLRGAAARQP